MRTVLHRRAGCCKLMKLTWSRYQPRSDLRYKIQRYKKGNDLGRAVNYRRKIPRINPTFCASHKCFRLISLTKRGNDLGLKKVKLAALNGFTFLIKIILQSRKLSSSKEFSMNMKAVRSQEQHLVQYHGLNYYISVIYPLS